jgi:N-acetyl-anhydromuramyl-L-alanine amidase AmpD
LEHETWAALVKELHMAPDVQPVPVPPDPSPGAGNPYKVRSHWLFKDNEQVATKLTHNFSSGTISPTLVIIHYTGTNSDQSALSWLTQSGSGVSCHLLITKTGVVWQLAPFNLRAWHAGVSSYDGESDCNSFSIGIENTGIGDNWPVAQIEANRQVVEALAIAYNIRDCVGHEDVAPGRKVDPGPNYPWEKVWT